VNALCCSPRLGVLMAVYFAASLAHFAHNAEYIAFYPGMPGWVSRETVYRVWLGVTSVGAAGLLAAWLGAQSLGLLLVGAYGALGLDGLGHYTLALCSEHTLGANVSIWAEVLAGGAVLLASAVLVVRSRA
jgi:hypothetical protein